MASFSRISFLFCAAPRILSLLLVPIYFIIYSPGHEGSSQAALQERQEPQHQEEVLASGAHEHVRGGKNISHMIGEFKKMVEVNEDTLSEPFEEDVEEKEPLNLAQDKITKDDHPPPKRRRGNEHGDA
jgi:hypothetical protein